MYGQSPNPVIVEIAGPGVVRVKVDGDICLFLEGI